MKKNIFAIITVLCLTNFSCEKVPSASDDWYYIYIEGEKGKQVEVSYIQRENYNVGEIANKNIIVTETVTLPYFKETHYVDFIGKDLFRDAFLEVKSSNDSTTKAIAFSDDATLEDGKCPIMAIFEKANAVGECAYCNELSMDSVLLYLKKINYSCYIEFKKTDTTKKVYLYTW